jgi:hypothetical protein
MTTPLRHRSGQALLSVRNLTTEFHLPDGKIARALEDVSCACCPPTVESRQVGRCSMGPI